MGLLWRWTKPALFALPPEMAHRLAISALKTGIVREKKLKDPRLQTRIGSLEFPHPLGLAAGFDKNGEVFGALLQLGFSHVEIGTITPRPQIGNPRPRLFRLSQDKALINRMGFNNDGHEALLQRLEHFQQKWTPVLRRKMRKSKELERLTEPSEVKIALKQRARTGIVGLNIGANKDSINRFEDYTKAIALFYDKVDYFTVNVSSPNTPGLRDLQTGENLNELLQQLQTMRADTHKMGTKSVSIFLKIAPDLNERQLDDIARTVLDRQCDGLVISNTTLGREGLVSLHAQEKGGLSGRPLFDLSTTILAKMRTRVGKEMPIIGIGGIENGASALEKIRAGADLIQIYSAMIYHGPALVEQILHALCQICHRDGVQHISEYRDQHVEKWANHPLHS